MVTRQPSISKERPKKNLEARFFDAPKLITVNTPNETYHPNLINKWFETHIGKRTGSLVVYKGDGKMLFKDNDLFEKIATQAIEGILQEGTKLGKDDEAEMIVRILNSAYKDDRESFMKKCLCVYTLHTFLFKTANEALKNDDWSKTDTLGPFCFLVNEFILKISKKQESPSSLCRFQGIVWRTTRLNEKSIEVYKKLKEDPENCFQWNGFTSTSTSKEIATQFQGNVLFKIEIINEYAVDISSLSDFKDEKEVLIRAGSVFRVRETISRNNKCFIHLECFYPTSNSSYPDTITSIDEPEDSDATEYLDTNYEN